MGAQRGELKQSELKETFAILLMAGVDTTSYLTAWLWLNLAQHPAKQEKLRQELERELGGADLDVDNVTRLPYLKACIRESHRYSPTSAFTLVRPAPQELSLCG